MAAASPARRALERLRPHRTELVVGAVLLLLFVLLRLRAAGSHALVIASTEEFINLRLARQLAADAPLGDLSRYWYGPSRGFGGAGPLVLAVLYAPFHWLFDSGFWEVRAMAIGWSVLGLGSMAATARMLLGRGAGLAVLGAALAAPPQAVAFSLTAYGNYTEAASLTAAGLCALLAFGRARSLRGACVGAGVLGLLAAFGVWFTPLSVPASAVLVVLGLALLPGTATRTTTRTTARTAATATATGTARLGPALLAGAALLAGLVLGSLPGLLIDLPNASGASKSAMGDGFGLLFELLASPSDWGHALAGSLAAMPMLEALDIRADEYAAAWPQRAEPALRGLSWLLVFGVGALAVAPARLVQRLGLADSWGLPHRVTVAAVALIAVGVPVGLTSIGVGPEFINLPSVHQWDPRRSAVVYPLWTFALAVALVALWRAPGWLRWPLRVVAVAVVVLQSLIAWDFASAGGPAPDPFRPERYLLCPSTQPVHETEPCVPSVWNDQVELLEHIVDSERLANPLVRRAALRGFGSVDRGTADCFVSTPYLPQVDVDGAAAVKLGWEYAGIAATVCRGGIGEDVCSRAEQPELQEACRKGLAWGRAREEAR